MTVFNSDLILARLNQLHPKSIDLSLDRLHRLLGALDHPETKLPPVVHIAGTNGKGSTLAMLDAMLRAAGKTTHRYVSPHLVRFNERILIDGSPIDDAMLAADLAACEAANAGHEITFFEITTAAAMLAFAREPADILLLETGLGGRLDATNVVAAPLLTLISPISIDHESYLGDTIAQIASEKAGIIKANVPVLAGEQTQEALTVLRAKANELNALLRAQNHDFSARADAAGLTFIDGEFSQHFPSPGLRGPHQIMNAGLAIAAARALGALAPNLDAIAQGLREAAWPARLQPIAHPPWLAGLPAGSTIELDGGHNQAAGEALGEALASANDERPVHVIVGMLTTKDVGVFLDPIIPHARAIWAVPIPDEAAAYEPDDIVAAIAGKVPAQTAASVAAAIKSIGTTASQPCRVLICGSLYLAGQVLRTVGS